MFCKPDYFVKQCKQKVENYFSHIDLEQKTFTETQSTKAIKIKLLLLHLDATKNEYIIFSQTG